MTTTRTPHSPAALVLAAAAALATVAALGGCAPADEPAPSAATAPADQAPPASPPPSPAPSDDGVDPLPEGECFVGEWTLDIPSWDAGILGVVEADLSSPTVATSGSLELTLDADQAYRVESSDLVTLTRGSGNGGDLEWTLGFSGEESGTWYTVSDILILDPGQSGRLPAQNEVAVDGVAVEGGVGDPSSTPWSDDLDVACDATTLTLTPLNDPAAIPVVFRR